MTYDALLERSVILRAAENVGHELAENGAAAHELHHASGDGGAEEGAAIKAAHDARGKFELTRESGADPVGVPLRVSFGDGFAEQFARAHRVEEAFAGERIDEGGSVADQRPVLADYGALGKGRNLGRGQNMAIETGGFDRELLPGNERLQVLAELALVVRRHAAADADR